MKITEHHIQKAFFQWVNLATGAHPCLRLFHAIPNGGQRNIITAAKLKAEGVRKGVLDTFLPVARGGYHGLYIEFKTPEHEGRNNGGLSADQLFFRRQVESHGYAAHIAYTSDHAVKLTLDYLLMPHTGVVNALTTIEVMQVAIADALQALAENGEEAKAIQQNAASFELCANAIKRGAT